MWQGVAISIRNVTECGSINLSVNHICDLSKINDTQRFSRMCHLPFLQLRFVFGPMCVCGPEGAVGGGES